MTATSANVTATPGLKRNKAATSKAVVPAERGDVDEVIHRLLLNPTKENVDLIERLLSIRAERAFSSALRAAQEEIPRILRDAHNDQTKSRFARLDTLARVVNPVVNRHGFSLSFGTADSKLADHYKVTCRLSHVGGHHRDEAIDVPAETAGIKGNPNKTAMHAMGSSMTYGRRYLMMMMFNLVLAGEDDDGVAGGHPPLTPEHLSALTEKIAHMGPKDPAKYAERLAKHMGAKSLAEVPDYKFSSAMNVLLNVQIDALHKTAAFEDEAKQAARSTGAKQ